MDYDEEEDVTPRGIKEQYQRTSGKRLVGKDC